ncbi:Mitochondrial translocator assembly and maintenance protein 41 [Gaertneriomyces sp. JEL0708]|nr:Mitochondrial translocator assembly and maintenance protein 41 [Gaertneriomyces sp. JEL0708]
MLIVRPWCKNSWVYGTSSHIPRRARYAWFRCLSTAPEGQNGSIDDLLQAVVHDFHAPIRFAVAYGSGVFPQKGYNYQKSQPGSKEGPMVDFIFGVTHPAHWHSLNIRQNRHHYSSLALLGSGVISRVQEQTGAGIYFNPDVDVAGMRIKYGVVSMDTLIRDLSDWETLYLAGRLSKPVKILRDDARVTIANRKNQRSTLRTALLLLPQEFSEEDLFLTIAGLSYRGDFRMTVGENPHKLYNMVSTQMDLFREIYKPIIEDLPNVTYTAPDTIQQDTDLRLQAALLQKLPKTLYNKIHQHHRWYLSNHGERIKMLDVEEPGLSQSIAASPDLPRYTEKSIVEIVKWPAMAQAIKGVFTAGIGRAVTYAVAKLKKSLAGNGKPSRR